ncbi:MAG: hypothetical protein ACM3WU_09425 [Bacillota bacterium]
MAGKFVLKKFADIDLSDPFFDSLKKDYPADASNKGFEKWFQKKAATGSTALVFDDDIGLGAFVCLKEEDEPIVLGRGLLPALPRVKISTLCIAERYRGQRLGEGALGLNSDPYKAFPFVNPRFKKAGYLIVNDEYHDTLFPYSELQGTLQESVAKSVTNGLCKIYVGAQYSRPHYRVGEPILIYRKHTKKDGQPRYKSCVTSFCVVNNVIVVKTNHQYYMSFDDLMSRIGNKSVFDRDEIEAKYNNQKNLVVIEMLYYGYFGAGNNVNMDWLDRNGYWGNQYPANVQLSPDGHTSGGQR